MLDTVFILGGGLQGCAAAFYLAQKWHEIHQSSSPEGKVSGKLRIVVFERSGIAAAASGHGGGFLAGEGWASSAATRDLHAIGFAEHVRLASDLGIDSFHRIPTFSVDVAGTNSRPCDGDDGAAGIGAWLDGPGVRTSPMDDSTAQVDPRELCEKFFEASGAELVLDTVLRVGREGGSTGRVTELVLEKGGSMAVGAEAQVLIAMGPWTGVFLEDNFGIDIGMTGAKSSSLVLDTRAHDVHQPFAANPAACFCAEDVDRGTHLELYPRKDGSLYVAGLGGSDSVAGDRLRAGGDCGAPELVQADTRRVGKALESLRDLSTGMADVADSNDGSFRQQACMRPLLPDALPLMDRVCPNTVVSCGHNCWGITWAPSSGIALADFILRGVSDTVNIDSFSLHRFISGESD
jgi:glycine/D-amino acid oxidase-like deaminating enzyme